MENQLNSQIIELTKRVEVLEDEIQNLSPIKNASKQKNGKDNFYTTGELQKYYSGSPFVSPEDLKPNVFTFAGNYISPDGSIGSKFGACISKLYGSLKEENYPAVEMSKIINAFANEERINILRHLLNKNMTARELMEKLNFKTTGKLYHHLSYLENIGIVYKSEEVYHIQGYAIGCTLMIFDCATRLIRRFDEKNKENS